VSTRVRVLVVDDSPTTRNLLREALSLAGGIEVVGEANDGEEAVSWAAELEPDVVLMDVRMPKGDGVQAAREITARHPGTKIVALTWLDDPSTVREMLAAGAMGYVVKGGTMDELSAAIKRATAGEPDLDQRVLPGAMEELRHLLEQERERREEVERLARARAELVQILSHELRTPLTVISGTLRMLEQSGVPEEQAPVLESAMRRTEELEFLVEGLELIEGGTGTDDSALPTAAIRGAVDRIGQTPDVVDVRDDPWDGVPQRYVHRVAFELLSNAFRHGARPIEVTARQDGWYAMLSVSDAGGWAASKDDFEPFFQRDMSETRVQRGFGLGLFVSSRLCQACGGELTIEQVDGRTVAEARFRLR
jgi:DNA-binding NarL/FixJ family response regulator